MLRKQLQPEGLRSSQGEELAHLAKEGGRWKIGPPLFNEKHSDPLERIGRVYLLYSPAVKGKK